jgi:dTMP kinase
VPEGPDADVSVSARTGRLPASSPGATRAAGRGTFVVLEGPDGAGKSVQAPLLAERLRRLGRRVTLTREPGGTRLGEQVRAILLDPSDVARGPVADALLFNAARSQLVTEVIEPALARGDTVVCDRFATSTLAYQGYGSGVDRGFLAAVQAQTTGGLEPDVIVLIDVPVEVGLARRDAGRLEEMTRFEDGGRHDLAFHERVRAGYLEMARADPVRWLIVDGSKGVDEVAEAVGRAVEDRLALMVGGI